MEERLHAPDGVALQRRAWLPHTPDRVLVILHGLGDHSGRYETPGTWFATRGCAVHAVDLRGHGRSEGLRGHTDRFESFLSDVHALLDQLQSEHPGQPTLLLGHGLGALLALALGTRPCPRADALVLCASAFAPPDPLPAARRAFARVLRRLRPRTRVATGVEPGLLSRDLEVARDYAADPLVLRETTRACRFEIESAARRLARCGEAVCLPTLVLHGDMDTIHPPREARTFYQRLRVPGSRLLAYPKLRHALLHEPEHEQVYENIHAWVLERGL